MTPEYGAASQLEKIDMLDFADFVAINKFDRKGALDALRDVSKQVQRNKGDFSKKPDEMLVFGTMAARFNDDGVTALYQAIAAEAERVRIESGRRQAADCADSPLDQPDADRSAAARALSGGDLGDGARLQEACDRTCEARARDPAAARNGPHAA